MDLAKANKSGSSPESIRINMNDERNRSIGFQSPLNFLERPGGVTKARQAHVHLVHHGEIEAAHLSVRFLFIVQHPPTPEASPGAPEHDHGKLRSVVVAR